METVKQQLYQPDSFARSGGLWPLKAGQTWGEAHYQVGPRVIDYYNLHFVMDGQVELHYSNQHIVLEKGDVFAMFPGIVYRYLRSKNATNLQMAWVSFDGPQAGELMQQCGFTAGTSYGRQVMNAELEYVLRQIQTHPSYDARRQVELISLLYRLFSLMIRTNPSIKPVGQDVWLSSSIAYMHTHYMERISVQDVANYASVHRGYFSKVFAERTGLSPVKYLQKLRMEKATELLRAGVLTIEEVALTLGYLDSYSFTHAFSKYYGMPPGQWRTAVSSNASGQSPDPTKTE
ncbi:helix-turn-helix domain-containing protein [Paenibacillus nasutitermitis]|uniref:HTH araC/xylS-type domain-containing protein n=1 Tax=Paenibacillus nasutitermitis TaxID=1652958 RepID=A0A916YIK6_9BACL|nr:AraC family transcriptional regulator [Paenibacillus nasutitermitis]GGD46985.1 hypothetical protein GCM10010911_00630 [Paenibacillus nasutitermitis]